MPFFCAYDSKSSGCFRAAVVSRRCYLNLRNCTSLTFASYSSSHSYPTSCLPRRGQRLSRTAILTPVLRTGILHKRRGRLLTTKAKVVRLLQVIMKMASSRLGKSVMSLCESSKEELWLTYGNTTRTATVTSNLGKKESAFSWTSGMR
ncbi:hypothetical protein V5799_021672 [Amblyomma americanum]|uniref:Uncharacterized protein n=1 Tax=Amblyomma americanum TaxID=6943 RepID=A0AAQ4FPB4_AMBAM